MKKICLTIIFGIFLISLASAEINLGDGKQGECFEIKQTCDNCTYVNISTVTRTGENATTFYINKAMTKYGIDYNYTFCDTSILGNYKFSVYGNKDGTLQTENGNFKITYNGNDLNIQNTILYLGLIVILILLFIFNLYGLSKLPSKDVMTDEGLILDINQLKYLRPILYAVAWSLLVGIIFITANISIAYLPSSMFGTFFFMLYKGMFIFTLPMVVIMFVYLFLKIFKDKEIKRMIERGVDIRGTP